jgi:DNA-binding response OmpR family regulator
VHLAPNAGSMNGFHRHISGNTHSEVKALLAEMRAAANNPARIRQLTDSLEVFALEHIVPSGPWAEDVVPGARLTRKETRILSRLLEAKGRVVSREQLMNALYFDRAEDEPQIKIVDVFICKLRRKLAGSRVCISTVHGQGFSIAEMKTPPAVEG